MNRLQNIALWLGAANLVFMLLFPPYDAYSFTDASSPIFSGFHFRFASQPNETINNNLLVLEILVLLVNVCIAWLLLRDIRNILGRKGSRNYQNMILLMMAVNLTLILLFPPFQFYFDVTSALLPSFQGFYFIFMAGHMLTIVTPILYLEVVFVLFNGGVLWLLFNRVSDEEPTPQEAMEQLRKIGGK